MSVVGAAQVEPPSVDLVTRTALVVGTPLLNETASAEA
jgi:hypothetical protein